MAEDLIRYDLLVQDAMRGVMRRVLADVAARGELPGEHHFTISFRTGAPGVKISKRLAQQWPSELTIILQHQYSNLIVEEDGFGVTLSFRSIPENLYIPYDAVTGFFDPSVQFALRWEIADGADDDDDDFEDDEAPAARPGPTLVRPNEPTPAVAKLEPAARAEPKAKTEDKPREKPAANAAAADDEAGAAKIVSIDAFRKKT